ncbi:hypothetical protein LEP1GSC034_0580 [Leptospira interrogans str. 2003000735]|uniref:Uncharacterized protein n=1 Tax=Leptospira interrogans serovar Australis str. 200703203 TaxID=1085541 RepID=N1UL21_LEPIR|nr:hypothetical protein [Leptospira interrogans]EMY26978.1 hypothetical protein LEP1GSC115_3628 [Leptospira interrogans serovar Australis str. 200703203]EKN87138.1 hypothetical protein LEP1GSC027_1031 [Leptospira interrogans str. 2002000624]EKQ35708.1 hypothetical protein LEP1GSC025_2726 [Leptospira interrogans str. 2002000621]EKQ49131.1 hypothetical protein LEP1GSC026_3571 [Leptospira interrogans str. 2002000623]EMJ67274.1 hypothetical protein LEP1GSC034_0580 [Leptospira interrogans str. 2003
MDKKILSELGRVLGDLRFLIQKKQIPILQFSGEKPPETTELVWKEGWEQSFSGFQSDDLELEAEGIQVRRSAKVAERNFLCKLCNDRISAVRNFLIKGRKPILVLHYTGEIAPGRPAFSKTSPDQIFRTKETEELFGRMIQKQFGFSHREFYYQEYPACIFAHSKSKADDWKIRTEKCETQVKDTIESEKIKGIILLGTSAIAVYGKEKALEMMGRTLDFLPGVPMIVLRSPEAISAIETKRMNFKGAKDSFEFETIKKEEISIKESILSQLAIFQNRLKDVL